MTTWTSQIYTDVIIMFASSPDVEMHIIFLGPDPSPNNI